MSPLPLFVSPGDDLIARNDDLVIFAQGDASHLRRMTNELAELVPSTDWAGLLRFLASKISTIGFDAHPPIACMRILDQSVDVFVFGDLSIMVETSESTETVTGAGVTTWREATISGSMLSASGGYTDFSTGVVGMLGRGIAAGGGFSLVPTSPAKSSGSLLSAISGATTVAATATPASPQPAPVEEVMPDDVDEVSPIDGAIQDASVADVTSEEVPEAPEVQISPDHPAYDADTLTSLPDNDGPLTPEQLAQTETISTPSVDHPSSHAASPADEDFDPNMTTAFSGAALSDAVRAARSAEPDPRRTSGVDDAGGEHPTAGGELRGVHCPNGHLSSMQHPLCRTCSEPVDMDGPIVSGPRPILGVIEFDDGVRIPLDRPVVIGRQPPEDYRINGEPAYVVPITDAEGLISRVHVEVHLIGWDIELIDKNSVNGTFTSTTPDSTSRTRLRGEHPTQIDIGTIIYVGDRVFRLNTGHIV